MPQLIDTHAHLYHKQFDTDRTEMIARAKEAGVSLIYLPNIDLNSIAPMLELEQAYPGYCHATMGLHPCSVGEDYRGVLSDMEKKLTERSFAGIGETGIDLYWDKSTFDLQREALKIQLQWAAELGRPIILHTREATAETLQIVRDFSHTKSVTGVFHCFSGNAEEAKEVLDLGFYLGIGGNVTYKNSGLPMVINEIGLDGIVLETDSPYLAPVPYRGKRNETGFIAYVAALIAESLELPVEEVCRKTSQNARKLFKA
jgi:TatD DNase family protein